MIPWLICCLLSFYYILGESDFLWEIQSQSYPRCPNFLENFNLWMLLTEVSKCWKIAEFTKILIKTKNFSHFTFPLKASCVSGTNIFLRRFTGVYRHLISNAVLGCLEMVQRKCFFWHQPETCLLENLQ